MINNRIKSKLWECGTIVEVPPTDPTIIPRILIKTKRDIGVFYNNYIDGSQARGITLSQVDDLLIGEFELIPDMNPDNVVINSMAQTIILNKLMNQIKKSNFT